MKIFFGENSMSIYLNHIGIVNRTKEEAIIFYNKFLAMKIEREFSIDSLLADKIFSINKNIEIIIFYKRFF